MQMHQLLVSRFARGWEVGSQANGRFVVRLDEASVRLVRDSTVAATLTVLERRLRRLSRWSLVGSPRLTQNAHDAAEVRVDLPGSVEVEWAKRLLTTQAQLRFKLVESEASSRGTLLGGEGGVVPVGFEIEEGPPDEQNRRSFYLVRREALVTDRDIATARAGIDAQTNAPDVQFNLHPQPAESFKQATGTNIGRRIAIVVDGVVVSAPTITGPIGESGVINGAFTREQASELARMLDAGALPVRVTCVGVLRHSANP
jgi:protein-export membrane protein SecD